jgi:glycine cleavage system H protein
MSQVPPDLQYTRTHEWVRTRPDGSLEIGITDHAQHALGDLVFVEAAQPGRSVRAGDNLTVVESVKTASDVYSPVAGIVTAVNPRLTGEPKLSEPELINKDPYGEGWLVRLTPAGGGETSALLTSAEYQALLASEGE